MKNKAFIIRSPQKNPAYLEQTPKPLCKKHRFWDVLIPQTLGFPGGQNAPKASLRSQIQAAELRLNQDGAGVGMGPLRVGLM